MCNNNNNIRVYFNKRHLITENKKYIPFHLAPFIETPSVYFKFLPLNHTHHNQPLETLPLRNRYLNITHIFCKREGMKFLSNIYSISFYIQNPKLFHTLVVYNRVQSQIHFSRLNDLYMYV